MLKPDEMVEVLLLGQKERMKEYVDALHELALLHIREPGTGDGVFQQGVPEPEAGKHSELITKLRIVLERVKIDADKKPAGQVEESAVEKNMDTIESIIHGTGISLIESTDRKEKLNDEIKRVEQHLSAIEEIRKLGLELGDFGPYEHIGVITGFCDSTLEQKFRDVNWVKITRAPRKARSTAFALFYPNEKEKELRDLIAGLQIREVKIGELVSYISSRRDKGVPVVHTFEELTRMYTMELKNLQKELHEVDMKIAYALKKYKTEILATREYLEIRVAKEELPQKILVGETSFLIDGWLPAREIEKLKKVSASYGVSVIPVEDTNEKPTKLNNPGVTKNFELLTRMYSLPRSEEIDPSLLMFITFPLFFGLIIGDIGYGLMLLGLALYLRNHQLVGIGGKQVGNVLCFAAISTIVFGFVFGEMFGLPFLPHGEHSGYAVSTLLGIEMGYGGLVNKFMDINFLMVATLIAGYVHLLLGFALGIYNEFWHKNYRHIIGKSGWIVILTGFFVGVMRLFAKIPLPVSTYYIIIPLFVIGTCLLIAGEGLIASLEFFSIFSNLLSYIRLFAVGVAKAGVAVAVNALVVPLFFTSYGIPAILAFFIIHFLLLLLGALSAGLHAIRLHYVEFFTKFYEGGGFSYNPFGYRRIYTKRGEKDGS